MGSRAARLALAFAVGSLLIGPHVLTARAGEAYRMETVATYLVQPFDGEVSVEVELEFTNTQPDPPGGQSVFPAIEFAVQSGASDPVATQEGGAPLEASIEERLGVAVASITLAEPLRTGQVARVDFTYRLTDGADPSIRIRPAVVAFPVWGFGTGSQVTVDMPADYEVRTTGDRLTPAQEADRLLLTSGPIEDPAHWLVLLGAQREVDYTTTRTTVVLSGATVDLQVRAWPDDPAWGARVLDLAARALVPMEVAIGLDWPGSGQLVITESATSGDPAAGGDQMAVAFDASDFVILHSLAHAWYVPGLFSDRWIREGLASHAAALVSDELSVAVPYLPAEEADRLQADAFPLVEWGALATDASGWAYASAWQLIDALAATAGEDEIAAAVAAAHAGDSGYADLSGSGAGNLPGVAVDSPRFVDLVEPLGSTVFTAGQLEAIFGAAAAPDLDARERARDEAQLLANSAGDLGLPDPVVVALVDWQFDAATSAISDALAWLMARDELVAEIMAAGLTVPDRLSAGYQQNGGTPAGMAEIAAERAVVDAYVGASELVGQPRSFVEDIGLLGREDPAITLGRSAAAFATGDLRTAAELSAEAGQAIEAAWWSGALRIAAVGVGLAAILAAGLLALRRRYTRRR